MLLKYNMNILNLKKKEGFRLWKGRPGLFRVLIMTFSLRRKPYLKL